MRLQVSGRRHAPLVLLLSLASLCTAFYIPDISPTDYKVRYIRFAATFSSDIPPVLP